MVSRLSRCVVVGCVLVTSTALVAGCERIISGTVRVAVPGSSPAKPVPLADLLIDPAQFPARYPAGVLDPVAVAQAVRDIDGVAEGSVVTPPDCAPAHPGVSPQEAVAAQGSDAHTSDRLTATLTRSDASLATRRDQLARCASFTTTNGDITTQLLPAPPVDADDSFAVDQTVSDPAGGWVRRLVLAAQIADVRVTAAWMTTDPEAEPDTQSLDGVFTDAVLKVRRDGQP